MARNLKFQLDARTYGPGNNCRWQGKYVWGRTYEKGTRIHFCDPVGVFNFDGFYDRNEEGYDEIHVAFVASLIRDLERKTPNHHGDRIFEYYEEDLDAMCEMFEIETNWGQLVPVREQLEPMANKDYEAVLIDRCPTLTVWFLNDMSKIISELKEVVAMCEAENVIMDWT